MIVTRLSIRNLIAVLAVLILTTSQVSAFATYGSDSKYKKILNKALQKETQGNTYKADKLYTKYERCLSGSQGQSFLSNHHYGDNKNNSRRGGSQCYWGNYSDWKMVISTSL